MRAAIGKSAIAHSVDTNFTVLQAHRHTYQKGCTSDWRSAGGYVPPHPVHQV
jgi:hypothetical protein